MNESAILEKIQSLSETVAQLEKQVEDLEDLPDLEQAIAENAGKPLINWDVAKKELNIE